MKRSREQRYRVLRSGEILMDGDQYLDPHNGKWYPTKCVGKKVGIRLCTSAKYRRPR